MDIQIDLIRDNPKVGRLYHLTCPNGRSFEVGLEYQGEGPFQVVYAWLDEQHFTQEGKQWHDPEDALRDIVEHVRELCQKDLEAP
jgi:hypothetical protein